VQDIMLGVPMRYESPMVKFLGRLLSV